MISDLATVCGSPFSSVYVIKPSIASAKVVTVSLMSVAVPAASVTVAIVLPATVFVILKPLVSITVVIPVSSV